MNVTTNEMLQVSSNCYYLAVQKTRNIKDWHSASMDTKKEKKRNPNDYFTYQSIKVAARCQICKICFHTTFSRILVIEYYCFYRTFLTVMML